ncbi:hypothetical protein D8B22_08935 [Verminephrobacter aporrectodeae subsp. tuberculatae]|nr:hypothetical protein [Verminephrobacter aporrectodeae subsp. tuberculatae]
MAPGQGVRGGSVPSDIDTYTYHRAEPSRAEPSRAEPSRAEPSIEREGPALRLRPPKTAGQITRLVVGFAAPTDARTAASGRDPGRGLPSAATGGGHAKSPRHVMKPPRPSGMGEFQRIQTPVHDFSRAALPRELRTAPAKASP